jgi:hypothetical protein
MSLSPLFADADVTHSYTRAQAIEDGVLVDVTATAKEAGFKVQVALTAAVWADCVAWDNEAESCHQDEAGRLWDLLYLAALEARRRRNAQVVPFGLLRVPHRGDRAELVQLTMHVGPGDEAEPVITIMQPGED